MPSGEEIIDSVNRMVDDYTKKDSSMPPPTQLAIGGTAGLCTGYFLTKTSKAAATAVGVSLIAFQFCNYRGWIKLNRSQFERDMKKLKESLRKEVTGRSKDITISDKDITKFLSENAYILGGFIAGWLVGFGLA